MSKELIARLRDLANLRHDDMSIGDEAADALEAQQKRIEEAEHQMHVAIQEHFDMEQELAAAQAQIKVLRDALEAMVMYAREEGKGLRIADEALAAPTDTTALREIKAGYEAHIKALRDALENCRLFAARRRAEEWATHILRLCESGGSVANPLRQDDSALRELLKAERERCAKVADEWQTAIHDPRYQCDCANAIRAMEDK